MAKFAFFPAPMTGHVNPFLGIAQELSLLGHEVTFYLPATFGPAVELVGARLRPYQLSHTRAQEPDGDATTRFALTPMWLAAECRKVLPQIEADVRELAPDIIVYDMLCVWGRLLARLLPARAAILVGSYVSNEHFSPVHTKHYQAMAGRLDKAFPAYAADIAALGETYGLSLSPRDMFARDEPLVLVIMPRAFHPAGETFDGRFHFTGVSLRPPGCDSAAKLPDLDGDRPVVLISFGTLVRLPEAIAETCAQAFADGVWQVVLVLDDEALPACLPPNVHAVRRVPQLQLLPKVSVFVTHGGTNSVVEAMHFGVPMVVLPEAPEHAITADRVAELGLGVALDPHATGPAELRKTVDAVAADGAIRSRLQAMSQAIAAAGGAASAATALTGLLSR